MEDQTIRLNIKVPLDLHRRFKATAAAQGESMTDIVLRMIEQYIVSADTSKK